MTHTQKLMQLTPDHDFFVGIDSDGCAFDTMEIKHQECFIPNTIKYWGLQPVARYAREAAEFVNLYSQWRGVNRWPALVKVFDLLRERLEVQARGFTPPQAASLRAFIASDGYPKSNAGLAAYMADHPGDAELETALAWTEGVNASVADIVHGVGPYPYVRESLQQLSGRADMIVVSATPLEALEREWAEHGLAQYVRLIAGQEMGSKKQHLALAAKGKYAPEHILMIGDAPGDMRAAKANAALFYPILPGHEAEAWQRFHEEAAARFLDGEYAGGYEAARIAEFEALLPELPPWELDR
ncbi:MAG: HAD family hydrolase [Anaerolineae bacterium]|nr:HAD family hydrolase [Anaerolineae bacterium]